MTRRPIETLWLVLPAIAEIVDEQHIGQNEAIAKLTEMLGDAASDARVQEGIQRLKAAPDELTFREMLGGECLDALEESSWPNELFGNIDEDEEAF